jgi:hypothetical protein
MKASLVDCRMTDLQIWFSWATPRLRLCIAASGCHEQTKFETASAGRACMRDVRSDGLKRGAGQYAIPPWWSLPAIVRFPAVLRSLSPELRSGAFGQRHQSIVRCGLCAPIYGVAVRGNAVRTRKALVPKYLRPRGPRSAFRSRQSARRQKSCTAARAACSCPLH